MLPVNDHPSTSVVTCRLMGERKVVPDVSPSLRLRPEQQAEIAAVRQLRNAAVNLRTRVSQGSYGDNELGEFWKLAEEAGTTMLASNSELGQRAGLGDGFFTSVSRDRRRPKLTNFL